MDRLSRTLKYKTGESRDPLNGFEAEQAIQDWMELSEDESLQSVLAGQLVLLAVPPAAACGIAARFLSWWQTA